MSSAHQHSVRSLFDGDTPDRRQWLLAVAAGMASFMDSAIIVSVAVGLGLIGETFGISTWGLGALSATLTFAIGAGSVAGGWLADKFGRMRMFTAYILFFGLGMGIMAFATSQPMLYAGVILGGFMAGADLPTSVAVVTERAPQGAQGRLIAVTQTMWSAGIVATMLAAFALSDQGMTGIRIIFGGIAALAIITWAIRSFHPWLRALEAGAHEAYEQKLATERTKVTLREIFSNRVYMVPVIFSMVFFVCWALVANTFGQFQTYFLVEAGGASQSFATGFGTFSNILGVVVAFVYIRVIDTPWRNKVFVVGGTMQVIGMVALSFGNGELAIYVSAISIFMLGVNLAGDANFKVWTQEGLPIDVRASFQGFSNGMGRFAAGVFALFTPQLIAANRDAVLWMLVLFATISLAAGVITFNYLRRRGLRPGHLEEAERTDSTVVSDGDAVGSVSKG